MKLQMQATKNKVAEKYLIPIARELAVGLDAVHKARVIHRDVKGMFTWVAKRLYDCS